MKFWFVILAVSLNLLPTTSSGQWLYLLGHKSTSRYLQRINTSTLEVVDVVRIPLPELTDIAFHPDGTLYCVEFSSFSILDTITGFTTLIKDFTGFEAVGLAVDYEGIFYLSGMYTTTQEFAVIRYNKDTDEIKKLASFSTYNFTHLDDLDFYNGSLYAVGLLPPSFPERQALFKVDTMTSTNHDTITTYQLGQSAAIGSFNDSCNSLSLVAISSGQLQFFYPDLDSVKYVEVLSPPNFRAGGATTLTGWMGSIPPLKINEILISDNPCDSEELAEITVNAAENRNLAVMFSLNGVSYQDSNYFIDVLPGEYQVFLQDEWGCKFISDTIDINDQVGFNYEYEVDPVYCDLSNGKFHIASLHFNDSLLFSIDRINFYTDTVFESLNPGDLTFYILNKEGCLDSSIITINTIDSPEISLSSIPEFCDKLNGEITAEVNFGTPPFTYFLNGIPQTTGNIQGLSAGVYNVLVVDDNGCEVSQQTNVGFIDGPELIDIVPVPEHCGLSDGSIEVLAYSATSTLSYSLNQGNYTQSSLFNNLPSGTYSLFIIDTFGCIVSSETTVSETSTVSILEVSTTPATCGLNNGQVIIKVNSIGNFQYSLNSGNTQNSPVFSDLPSGTYLISVITAEGCSDTMTVEIEEAPYINIQNLSVNNASCNLRNGAITVHATGNNLLFSLNNSPLQNDSSFVDLEEGLYTISVFDEFGCSDITSTNILQTGIPKMVNVVVLPEHCNKSDGSLIIESVTGGSIPFQYSINNSSFQLTPNFENLPAETYLVNLIDANGCMDTIEAIILLESGPIINSKIITPEICDRDDGSILIKASSPHLLSYSLSGMTNGIGYFPGLPSSLYSITIEDPFGCHISENIYVADSFSLKIDGLLLTESECNGQTGRIEINSLELIQTQLAELPGEIWGNTISNLGPGNYNLTISDTNNCAIDTIIIIDDTCNLYLPNVFSPNGDNINDVFGTSDFPAITYWNMEIFDRSGNMVFYTIDPTNGWTGYVQDRPAQAGVYTWILKYSLNGDPNEIFRKGGITLIR